MRKIIVALFIVMLAVPAFAASDPSTEEDKALYAMGVFLANQIPLLNLTAEEFKFVQQGFVDKATGEKIIAEPFAYQQQMDNVLQAKRKRAVDKEIANADKEKAKSKEYLENAAKEKGAQKTNSGLIYVPITVGTGKQPKSTDVVLVNFTGSLIDGKEFENTAKYGKPVPIPLNQFIKCWSEGVTKMKVGGKAKLVCPSSVAFGDVGITPTVPGGATVVYEVELLDVKALPAAKPSGKKK